VAQGHQDEQMLHAPARALDMADHVLHGHAVQHLANDSANGAEAVAKHGAHCVTPSRVLMPQGASPPLRGSIARAKEKWDRENFANETRSEGRPSTKSGAYPHARGRGTLAFLDHAVC